jgi:HAD superfamily hydrolase (TIGR01549 family)
VSGVKLAIFDMDGTLFESYLDWPGIKREMKLDNDNILKSIYRNNQVDERLLSLLEKYEKENTLKTRPFAGIGEFLQFLDHNRIKRALVTNNSRTNTDYLLRKFNLKFHEVITRESGLWKPDPEPFFHVMSHFSCPPEETLSIGDSDFDITASKKAKITDIFVKNSSKIDASSAEEPVYFENYLELKRIIQDRYSFLSR